MPRARAARCCVREVGLCRREYIWSVQKENYTFIQYNTCRVELTPHREKSCSLLTAILTRLLSVQFSQAGVNYFQCITPPPPPKKKPTQQQQHKNNRRWSDCRTLLTADQSHKSLSRRVYQTRSNLGVLITPTSQDERGQQRRPPPVSPATSRVQHVTSCVCNNARQSSVTGPARHSASTTMAPNVQCHPSSTSLLFKLRRL